MKPEFIIGYIEVVYNPNGHTFWMEAIIDGLYTEYHWDGNLFGCQQGVEDFVKSINPEYWVEMTEFFCSGRKSHYHYNIWW